MWAGGRVKQTSWLLATFLLTTSTAQAMAPKDIYKKDSGAVVLILGSDDGKQGSGGTGSIIEPDGKIITNAHVVLSHSNNQPFRVIYVFLKPAKVTGDNAKDLVNRYKAHVVGFSPPEELDLALLQLEQAPPNLPTVAFADPDGVDIGDEVVAIGHPEQGGLWTLTTGAVSTVISNYGRVKGKDVFQTEASVNRGNSGGPLLDTHGNMVGINTMIARQAADGVAITSVNFSLKSSVAVNWLASVQGIRLAYATGESGGGAAVAAAPAPALSTTATPAPASGRQKPQASAPATAVTVGDARATVPPTRLAPVVATPGPAPTLVPVVVPNAQQVAPEVVTGKRLDPATVKPKFITEKRPYNIDDLRMQQMKELEDMMRDMSGRGRAQPRGSGDGLGLW